MVQGLTASLCLRMLLQAAEEANDGPVDPTKFVAKKSKAAAKKGVGNTQVRHCGMKRLCAPCRPVHATRGCCRCNLVLLVSRCRVSRCMWASKAPKLVVWQLTQCR